MHEGKLLALAWCAVVCSACQLDPGEFSGYQTISGSRTQVAWVHVESSGGVTTEHWVFNLPATYDATRGVETAPNGLNYDMTSFTSAMCAQQPIKKYLQVATTEFPLDCNHPTQPSVATPADAILADGTYRVMQRGANVGTVWVSGKVENWGVSGSFNRRSGFTVEPTSALSTWAAWANHVCQRYNPRTYWVVTSTPATLCH